MVNNKIDNLIDKMSGVVEEEKRKLFYAVISFMAPVGGTTTILARDKKHAEELLAEMHKETQGFRLIDIHDMDENPEFKKLLEAQMTPSTEGGAAPVLN